jgi:hypothetical protein
MLLFYNIYMIFCQEYADLKFYKSLESVIPPLDIFEETVMNSKNYLSARKIT